MKIIRVGKPWSWYICNYVCFHNVVVQHIQHANFSSCWNKSSVRFQLQPKNLKVCTNSSFSFINSKDFIFPFPLKQLTLSQPVNACRESRTLETISPHFSATDQAEIKQDHLLVLHASQHFIHAIEQDKKRKKHLCLES